MYINAGLIGFPLSHSLSPSLHSYFFHLSGINGGYCCFETLSSEDIKQTLEMFKKYSFAGFNITVPYKTDIIKYCSKIDKEAFDVGAVNTVKITEGELYGYNTDIYGFGRLLEMSKISTRGKKVLLLGAGGAARGVVAYMNKNSPSALIIANRTKDKGQELAKFCCFDTYVTEGFDALKGNSYDLVINSTSLGLRGEIFPDLKLNRAEAAVDLQYGAEETPFLKKMEKASVKSDGLPMLIYQASKAFEIWTGIKTEPDIPLLCEKLHIKNKS